ncbi:MAG: hypothetical protein AAF390_21015, partial [Pseudomonadota bacterium]
IGGDAETVAFRKALVARGVVGSVFCAPAVPRGRAIVRLTIHAGMGPDDIAKVIAAFEALKDMPRLREGDVPLRAVS